MLNIAKLATGLTTVALTVALSPVAASDPAIPLDPGQLPGLQAMQSLSPVVQQAAANPKSAQELLLAAASQLAGSAATPEGSLALAQAVSKFVQDGGAAGMGTHPGPARLSRRGERRRAARRPVGAYARPVAASSAACGTAAAARPSPTSIAPNAASSSSSFSSSSMMTTSAAPARAPCASRRRPAPCAPAKPRRSWASGQPGCLAWLARACQWGAALPWRGRAARVPV